jgi:hypothetical protein
MNKIKGLAAVMICARRQMELAPNPNDGCYYGDILDEVSGHTIHFGIFPAKDKNASDN